MTAQQCGDFLVFKLVDELYGIPLLSVREISEPQVIKQVPYAPPYYLGVMNIRGKMVSIIDLRKKLKVEPRPGQKREGANLGYVMLLDLPESNIGLIVDAVVGVKKIADENVTPSPANHTVFDTSYLIGATRLDGALVTLINLAAYISGDEFGRGDHAAAAGNSRRR